MKATYRYWAESGDITSVAYELQGLGKCIPVARIAMSAPSPPTASHAGNSPPSLDSVWDDREQRHPFLVQRKLCFFFNKIYIHPLCIPALKLTNS